MTKTAKNMVVECEMKRGRFPAVVCWGSIQYRRARIGMCLVFMNETDTSWEFCNVSVRQ